MTSKTLIGIMMLMLLLAISMVAVNERCKPEMPCVECPLFFQAQLVQNLMNRHNRNINAAIFEWNIILQRTLPWSWLCVKHDTLLLSGSSFTKKVAVPFELGKL
uniref:Uncharacterized protein n=1 Tax=Glossina brevipalpis TaxID=37001 RepID=A0A1A9X2J1_9MUSC